MRNLKGLLCLVLVLILVLAPTIEVFAEGGISINININSILKDLKAVIDEVLAKFKDIKPNTWYTETVAKLVKLGIVDGYTDGTFRPNNTIKRDEFIKLTVSSMGYKLEIGQVYWAKPFIDKAIELGLIAKDEFADYTVNITREEMTSIVVNAALKTTDTVSNANSYDHLKGNIKDYHKISDRYKQQVLYAYDLGIVSGYEDGTVRPKNNATRAEASAVIMRYLDKSLRTYPKIDMAYVELKEYNTESYWYDSWFLDYMKVYAPVRNGKKYTEFIEVAQVLKDNMHKTKNFGVVGYAKPVGSISSYFYEIPNEEELEEHVNKYPYYVGIDIQDLRISIETIDWDMNPESHIIPHRRYPYRIRISKLANYKNHSEVVEAVLKELFGKDSTNAISELNKAVKDNMSGNTTKTIYDKTFNFNNRKLVIENNSLNLIDIYVSPKLK